MPLRIMMPLKDALVALDLSELLQRHFDAEILVHWPRPDLDVHESGAIHAAIFDVSLDVVIQDPGVQMLRRARVPIIVIDGSIPAEHYEKAGVGLLTKPFRSDDVIAALAAMGVRPA